MVHQIIEYAMNTNIENITSYQLKKFITDTSYFDNFYNLFQALFCEHKKSSIKYTTRNMQADQTADKSFIFRICVFITNKHTNKQINNLLSTHV